MENQPRKIPIGELVEELSNVLLDLSDPTKTTRIGTIRS